MGTTLCQLISIFERRFQPITVETGPGKLQKLRNPKILLRKSGEMIFQHFFDESSVVTGFEGSLQRPIFGVKKKKKKIEVQGSEVKPVVFFGKSKDRPFIIHTDTFWYFIASYEKMRIKNHQFFIFFSKTPKLSMQQMLTVLALSRFQKIIFVILFNKQP